MANYSNGLATREKILDVCKVLFCEQGYIGTSFTDICNMSEVNPGTITHHFKNKKNLGGIFYNSMLDEFTRATRELFPQEDAIQQNMLSVGMHLKLFYENPNYRRFSSEFSSESLPDDQLEEYELRVNSAYELVVDQVGVEKANFLFAAFKGMDCYLEPYISNNIDTLSFESAYAYIMELYHGFLSRDEFDKRIELALKQVSTFKISFDYFDLSIELLPK